VEIFQKLLATDSYPVVTFASQNVRNCFVQG